MPGDYPRELRTIGDHLRKRRLDLSLRQRDVAARIGVDTTTVTNWELGHSKPALRVLPAIWPFLGYIPRCMAADTLAGQLRVRRQVLGWTQKRLARELSVDPSTLAKWERAERVPTGRILLRIREVVRG